MPMIQFPKCLSHYWEEAQYTPNMSHLSLSNPKTLAESQYSTPDALKKLIGRGHSHLFSAFHLPGRGYQYLIITSGNLPVNHQQVDLLHFTDKEFEVEGECLGLVGPALGAQA